MVSAGGPPSTLPLHCDLWVVPYAGWNPPARVGGALCRAEPSEACGWFPMVPYAGRNPPMLMGSSLWCPMPGGTLRCLWVVPYGALCRGNPPPSVFFFILIQPFWSLWLKVPLAFDSCGLW